MLLKQASKLPGAPFIGAPRIMASSITLALSLNSLHMRFAAVPLMVCVAPLMHFNFSSVSWKIRIGWKHNGNNYFSFFHPTPTEPKKHQNSKKISGLTGSVKLSLTLERHCCTSSFKSLEISCKNSSSLSNSSIASDHHLSRASWFEAIISDVNRFVARAKSPSPTLSWRCYSTRVY